MGRRTDTRLVAVLAIAAITATLATGAGNAATAAAQGVDTTCVLPLTKIDPGTVNVAYPDEAALYWIGAYQAVPGTRLRISGRYPHARYASFNVYDNAQRPLDALADVEIGPDPGSLNPFTAGASRTAAARDYSAFVDFGAIPPRRAPNTLYTGTGQNGLPNVQGTFIYRVYIPDAGRDDTGGVGLPTITVESTATGSRPPDSVCSQVTKPSTAAVNQPISQASGPPVPSQAGFPGSDPPRWVKFKNLVQVANKLLTGNPYLDDLATTTTPAEEAGGKGAFLSNLHNAYVYTLLNRAFGDVSVTKLRAPTFPDTRGGTPVMPAGQLRYFSLCTNETASQRYIACASDDRSVRQDDGTVDYVVSTPATRPSTATAACGYTWLPSGPATESSLILRHMLPDPGFAQAIQRATPEHETATMGDYFPSTRYVRGALPCAASVRNTGPALGLPGTHRCRSRRHFRIHLRAPHGVRLRSATIMVAGRRVKALHGPRLHARVDLRGLPKGRYRVRIVARTTTGRRLVSVRTYRTCAPKPKR